VSLLTFTSPYGPRNANYKRPPREKGVFWPDQTSTEEVAAGAAGRGGLREAHDRVSRLPSSWVAVGVAYGLGQVRSAALP
jgi:hypothetical protein